VISTRKQQRLYYNSSTDRVIVTIESIPCVVSTQESGQVFMKMMQEILDDSKILNTGGDFPFDKASIIHTGACWQFKSETLVIKGNLNGAV